MPLIANNATSPSAGVRRHSIKRSSSSAMKAPDARRSRSCARLRSVRARRNASAPNTRPSTRPSAAPTSINSRNSQDTGRVLNPKCDDRISDTKKKADKDWISKIVRITARRPTNYPICLTFIHQGHRPICRCLPPPWSAWVGSGDRQIPPVSIALAAVASPVIVSGIAKVVTLIALAAAIVTAGCATVIAARRATIIAAGSAAAIAAG